MRVHRKPACSRRNAIPRGSMAPSDQEDAAICCIQPRKERPVPAKTEKQRKFMGAELQRKRKGKKTKTDMSEKELKKMASKKS
jgi:hypothetical protein